MWVRTKIAPNTIGHTSGWGQKLVFSIACVLFSKSSFKTLFQCLRLYLIQYLLLGTVFLLQLPFLSKSSLFYFQTIGARYSCPHAAQLFILLSLLDIRVSMKLIVNWDWSSKHESQLNYNKLWLLANLIDSFFGNFTVKWPYECYELLNALKYFMS